MMRCGRGEEEARGTGEEMGMVALVCEEEKRESLIEDVQRFLGTKMGDADADKNSASGSEAVDRRERRQNQQVSIANINSKNQIVLSGNIARIRTLLSHLQRFAGHDPRAVRLKADSPFHSPVMAPAAAAMQEMLAQPSSSRSQHTKPSDSASTQPSHFDSNEIITFPALIPCISNVTARPFTSLSQLKDLLARQCVETVRWHDSIPVSYTHLTLPTKRIV